MPQAAHVGGAVGEPDQLPAEEEEAQERRQESTATEGRRGARQPLHLRPAAVRVEQGELLGITNEVMLGIAAMTWSRVAATP